MSEKTTAIITTYNPDAKAINNARLISCQVDRVIICDNSPENHGEDFADIERLDYYHMDGNLGITGAINFALKSDSVGWNDRDLIFLFDQDSEVRLNHVDALVDTFHNLEKEPGRKVGALGPLYMNRNSDSLEMPRFRKEITKDIWRVKSIITSSMLIRYSTIRETGFFNEDLFLDFADWDLCWRLQKKGYNIYLTSKSILNHAIGEGGSKEAEKGIHVSAPYREYYQIRDSLYLLKKRYVPIRFRIRLRLNTTIVPWIHIHKWADGDKRKPYIKKGRADFKAGITGAGDLTDMRM